MPTNEDLVTTEPALAISTRGEVRDWITHEAVGNSAHAAAYLENMRELIAFVDNHRPDPTGRDETQTAVYTLAAAIGEHSERSFQKHRVDDQGNLVNEIDGVVPVREVSDGSILHAVVEFDPNHPSYKGYQNSEAILEVHNSIEQLVAQQLNERS